MKLYYSPGACSLASHILLNELNLPHTLEAVNLQTKTYRGGDFLKVNPKGSVPTLGLDDGQVLTENVAILPYLSDLKPEAKLMPKAGSLERYRALEWLAFIATEMHKSFSPLFHAPTVEVRKKVVAQLHKRFAIVAQPLKQHDYLLGTTFTAPDAYLYVMTTWAAAHNLDLSATPEVLAFAERVQGRPAVQVALKAEAKAKLNPA